MNMMQVLHNSVNFFEKCNIHYCFQLRIMLLLQISIYADRLLMGFEVASLSEGFQYATSSTNPYR